MPCTIDKGRGLGCRDAMGGIKAIYFINFGAAKFTMGADDEITGIDDGATPTAGPVDVYRYLLKSASGLTQNIQSSLENGTVFYEQIVNMVLQRMTKEDNKLIKLLAWGRPYIVVSDYNDDGWLVGRVNGAEVTGGTIVTGVAFGDLNGQTLDFTANERIPANFIDGFTGITDGNPFPDPFDATVNYIDKDGVAAVYDSNKT